mmetsp:Transcript_28247/g.39039  ORF Transcript_28247/g.39039 Transcript_28247/m.39039 type:complete len:83 (+) Transcript_28247:87-335(+)
MDGLPARVKHHKQVALVREDRVAFSATQQRPVLEVEEAGKDEHNNWDARLLGRGSKSTPSFNLQRARASQEESIQGCAAACA